MQAKIEAVLDDGYADLMRQRFTGRPSWSRPPIYDLATLATRARQRCWLGATLKAIPPLQRDRFRTRLEAPRSFLAAYNELAVAAILQGAGFEVVLEPEADGKTPDLLVTRDAHSALVEVYTRFRTDQQLRDEQRWRELAARVTDIGVPVAIVVRATDGAAASAPDSTTCVELVERLRKELLSLTEPVGRTVVIGRYAFQVHNRISGVRAMLSTPPALGWHNADQVLDAVREKVSRYATIASSHGWMLVVIAAAEPQSSFTGDLLRVALTGAQSIVTTLDPFGPTRTGPHRFELRQTNEVVRFHPAVSGIGWLAAGLDEPGPLTVYPVESAEYPLPWTGSDRLELGRIADAS